MTPALVMIRTCVWNATFRRPLSLLMFLIAALFIWMMISRINKGMPDSTPDIDWEAEYEKMRLAGLKENMQFYIKDKKDLKPVPVEWTAQDKCPACFGNDMCDKIEKGEIMIDIPATETPASKKGVYLGHWKDIPIAVKRLSNWYPKQFESFDKYLCKETTGSETCKISDIIVSNKSLVQQPTTFETKNMHQLWKISHESSGPLSLAYTLCATPQVVKMFSDMYDSDRNGVLSRDEKAMLFTSMVVQPESLMLKFLKGIQFQRLAPRAYGACGRLVVVEHGGHLLSEYLNNSFSERAELAMQLMSLVQVLWHADRRWFALYRDFEFDNFAVSHEKEIYIIDYEELNIIENVDFDEEHDEDRHEEHSYGHNVTCNDDCFYGLLTTLSNDALPPSERQTHCQSLHSVAGSLMYSTLCRNLLSDLPEHRAKAGKDATKYRGLLHSVPKFDNADNADIVPEKVADALRECVHESAPGRRVQAVNDLSDALALYLRIA